MKNLALTLALFFAFTALLTAASIDSSSEGYIYSTAFQKVNPMDTKTRRKHKIRKRHRLHGANRKYHRTGRRD